MENQSLTPLMTPLSEEQREALRKEREAKLGDKFKYLILLEGEYRDNDGENYRTFEFITGRQDTYDFIKELLKSQDEGDTEYILDVSLSRILSEPPASMITPDTPRLTLSNMLSVYSFMKLMKDKGKVVDNTDFNIEDYFDGYIDDEFED